MTCPYCKHQNHLEIDLHADGFSGNLIECSDCGALLTTNKLGLETVFGPNRSFHAHEVFSVRD